MDGVTDLEFSLQTIYPSLFYIVTAFTDSFSALLILPPISNPSPFWHYPYTSNSLLIITSFVVINSSVSIVRLTQPSKISERTGIFHTDTLIRSRHSLACMWLQFGGLHTRMNLSHIQRASNIVSLEWKDSLVHFDFVFVVLSCSTSVAARSFSQTVHLYGLFSYVFRCLCVLGLWAALKSAQICCYLLLLGLAWRKA